MNKNGQIYLLTLMIGITILVLALALAPGLRAQVDETRANLDCSNSSISTFDQATCVVADLTIFHFIGALIFIAGMVITAKVVFQ